MWCSNFAGGTRPNSSALLQSPPSSPSPSMAPVTKHVHVAATSLALSGWVCVLAGIGRLTALLAGNDIASFRNYPVSGLADAVRAHALPSGNAALQFLLAPLLSPIGQAFSYAWWVMTFQLVGIVLAAVATSPKGTAVRSGAAYLQAVLTASTFLLTADVANAPTGVYALTHNGSGTFAPADDKHSSGTMALIVFFAGLIICDIANVVLLFSLPAVAAAAEAQPPAVKAKEVEAPAAVEAVEAAAAAV